MFISEIHVAPNQPYHPNVATTTWSLQLQQQSNSSSLDNSSWKPTKTAVHQHPTTSGSPPGLASFSLSRSASQHKSLHASLIYCHSQAGAKGLHHSPNLDLNPCLVRKKRWAQDMGLALPSWTVRSRSLFLRLPRVSALIVKSWGGQRTTFPVLRESFDEGGKEREGVSGMEAGPRSLGVKALYCLVSGFVFEISDQASFLKPTLPTLWRKIYRDWRSYAREEIAVLSNVGVVCIWTQLFLPFMECFSILTMSSYSSFSISF